MARVIWGESTGDKRGTSLSEVFLAWFAKHLAKGLAMNAGGWIGARSWLTANILPCVVVLI